MTMKRIELIHITVTIHTSVHSNIVLFATAVSVGFQSLGLGVVLGVLGETRTAPTLEPAVGLQSLVKTLFWSIIIYYYHCYYYCYYYYTDSVTIMIIFSIVSIIIIYHYD